MALSAKCRFCKWFPGYSKGFALLAVHMEERILAVISSQSISRPVLGLPTDFLFCVEVSHDRYREHFSN
jgi:hypothetical protein